MKLRERRKLKEPARYIQANFAEIRNPLNYKEAVWLSDKEKWEAAIEEELESQRLNNSWEVVDCPADVEPIDSIWVFTKKHDSSGKVKRYKARLCARGCKQKFGID